MIRLRDFNAEIHEKFRVLGLLPEQAEKLTRVDYEIDGVPVAEVSVVLQPKNTEYRGDVLVGAVGKRNWQTGEPGSYVCGLVELWDVRPCRGLLPDEWRQTVVPPRADRARWYAYFFRNPRRVIEMPHSLVQGMSTVVFLKGEVMEYPRNVIIGSEEWAKIRKKYGI